jgi:geranylgeranyl diphosphate synthase type II
MEDSLDQWRTRIEAELRLFIQLGPDCPDRLRQSMEYSLTAGGKRLRPCLCLLACESVEGDVARALPAACAIEMVHTYSLIHDDLPAMDDVDIRRGRPTNHKAFDEATAVLAGDGLLTYAFELIATHVTPAETAIGCVRELASAAGPEGMVAGQMADLLAEECEQPTLKLLESSHRRKTGRLIAGSLVIGGLIGGADPQSQSKLRRYGESIGLAFQIVDDLLDITGQQEKMGKGVGKDSAVSKLTYPSLLGVEGSQTLARELIDNARREIEVFGQRALGLDALARFIIERDH